MDGRIYVFSGPSGVGKSTVIRKIFRRVTGLGYSISHTTRCPRRNEVDGKDYHFVDMKTFQDMIKENAFVEWAKVYNDLYGTTFSSLNNTMTAGMDVILDIDVQGAKNIRKHFNESILIFILPPSIEILEQRLRDRSTDDEKIIRSRIEKARFEVGNCHIYDFLIMNDVLEKAVIEAASIILADRCSRSRALPEIRDRFNFKE